MLQGLAEKGLLPFVDYLSTVSGGGYIGAWLYGIISRVRGAGSQPATAQEQMDSAAGQLLRGVRSAPGAVAQDPISFLRSYSNYLAPRPGLFSADTWTIGFIWFRNVLLNQLMLVPAIAAAVVVALLMVFAYQIDFGTYSAKWGFDVFGALIAAACLAVAAVSMGRNLRPIAKQSVTSRRVDAGPGSQYAGILTVALVFASMVAIGSAHFEAEHVGGPLAIAFSIVMAGIQIAGGFADCYVARRKTAPGRAKLAAVWNVVWMSATTGIVAALLVTAVWRTVTAWDIWFHVVFGPPMVGVCFIVSVMLLVGMMGVDYPDAAREWTARIGSTLGIVTAAWLTLLALMVFGPWAVAWLLANFEKSGLAAIVAWLVTTVGGVLAGRSPRTSDDTEQRGSGGILGILTSVAPTVFLVGYILVIAAGVHALMPYTPAAPALAPSTGGNAVVSVNAPPDRGVEVKVTPDEDSKPGRMTEAASRFSARYPSVLALRRNHDSTLTDLDPARWSQLDWALVLLFGTTVVAIVAARRININEFSLHHFYKNRLVRCYLGASQGAKRKPHPLTGFDPLDDFPIAALDAHAPTPYYGPYPIINTALNLNAGSELATQERKGASFVFTPAFCGFHTPTTPGGQSPAAVGSIDPHGYRETAGYGYPAGPDVGTAVAISGAAANPNSGYHTSGPMAFLLTVFNARLGWWLGNPRWEDPSRRAGPKFALKYLFAELLGQTTGGSRFVNLSDGGHFDNLGLYELIRRRTRFIIVCDAEEDHALTFGSLGGAIRKCRADFGVEIDIDPEPIRVKHGFSTAHCVVGTIVYPERETAFHAGLTSGLTPRLETADSSKHEHCRGWLLYLKSSLTGDEPADVTEYRSQHAEFPHQSTADQFFSESQFESYRRLGYHVLRSAFEGVVPPTRAVLAASARKPDDLAARYPLVPLFQALTRKWYAPIAVSAEAATRLANDYVELMKTIAANPKLEALHYELVNGKAWPKGHTGDASPAEVGAGIELMQLVQNVYTEFGLEHAVNRVNPRNSGWMSVFVKWRQSAILARKIWPTIAADYHALFQRFVTEDLADGDPAPPERP